MGRFVIITLCLLSPLLAQPKNWAGCGPTYDGRQFGASCDYAQKISPSLYGWASYDARPYLKGQASTAELGVAPILTHFRLGSLAEVYLVSISTGGTTQTANSTKGAFAQGMAIALLWKSGWSLALIARGVTGQAGGVQGGVKIAFSWD